MMTFSELRSHENVKAAEIVQGGALLTYTSLGEGECDQCEATYTVGDALVGLHERHGQRFDPEVSRVFCSRDCAVCWLEMHR